jgi:hypothetical protein
MHVDNAALAAEYQLYLGEAEKWFRHAKEETRAGVDTKSARGVATGYTGEPYGPLTVFNEWADRRFAKQLAPGYFDKANLTDRAAFDVWQAEMVRDIRAHWSKKRKRSFIDALSSRASRGEDGVHLLFKWTPCQKTLAAA